MPESENAGNPANEKEGSNESTGTPENQEVSENEVPESNDQEKKLTTEEMKAEIDRLSSSNVRLLEESKKHKNQKQKAQEELLLAQDKKDELIETQRGQIKDLKDGIMSAKITEAVSLEAAKRGCEDWDMLLQVADTTFLDYNEDTESVNGVKDFFDQAQADERIKGKFFVKKQPFVPNSQTPDNESASFDYRKDPLGYLDKCKKI